VVDVIPPDALFGGGVEKQGDGIVPVAEACDQPRFDLVGLGDERALDRPPAAENVVGRSEIARIVLGTSRNRLAAFPQVRALRRHGALIIGRGTAAPVAALLPPRLYRAYLGTPKKPR
jgi:hypothetical protein